MDKKLVAYFSATGTTKRVAQKLADVTTADLYEICPQNPYSSDDLNWMDKKSRSTIEMKDPSARPELASRELELEVYSTIYLGFPIWWYTAPAIIRTFLESHDFSGKKIILFATSGGSGLGNTVKDLSVMVKDAVFIEGGLLNDDPSTNQLVQWVEQVAACGVVIRMLS